jgi:hypothetical protein
MRFNIETCVGIPKSGSIEIDKMKEVLSNKNLDIESFIKFKDELYIFDIGIFIIGYLVDQCEGKINVSESDQHITVSIEIPFNPKDPNNTQALNNGVVLNYQNHGLKDLSQKPDATILRGTSSNYIPQQPPQNVDPLSITQMNRGNKSSDVIDYNELLNMQK